MPLERHSFPQQWAAAAPLMKIIAAAAVVREVFDFQTH